MFGSLHPICSSIIIPQSLPLSNIPSFHALNQYVQLFPSASCYWKIILVFGLGFGVFFPSGFLSLYFFPCGHFLILGTRNWKNENSNYVAGHRHHGLSRENRDECCVVRTLPNGSHRSHFWSTRCNNIDGGFSFN